MKSKFVVNYSKVKVVRNRILHKICTGFSINFFNKTINVPVQLSERIQMDHKLKFLDWWF